MGIKKVGTSESLGATPEGRWQQRRRERPLESSMRTRLLFIEHGFENVILEMSFVRQESLTRDGLQSLRV